MTQQIGWGILGCARIARRGLIPGIRASKSGRLIAIASRDGDKARRWAEEFDLPRSYGSYEELLADREIDAVYIPLPNELHRLWTIAAAAAGKHVLCDKPLALNAREAEEMVAACRAADVVLMEGFMWRHQPRTTRAVELIRSGAIGDVRIVRCSFSFDIDRSDWRLDSARGGGLLWDIGCYGVNTCRLLCGEPEQVQAIASWWPTGVDMTLAATLQFPGDVLGQIDSSFETPFRCSVEVVGTRGSIVLPRAYLPAESPEILVSTGDTMESITCPASDQYAAMIEHFSAAIRDRCLSPPAEDGLANMRVLDAVLQAARGDASAALG